MSRICVQPGPGKTQERRVGSASCKVARTGLKVFDCVIGEQDGGSSTLGLWYGDMEYIHDT